MTMHDRRRMHLQQVFDLSDALARESLAEHAQAEQLRSGSALMRDQAAGLLAANRRIWMGEESDA